MCVAAGVKNEVSFGSVSVFLLFSAHFFSFSIATLIIPLHVYSSRFGLSHVVSRIATYGLVQCTTVKGGMCPGTNIV